MIFVSDWQMAGVWLAGISHGCCQAKAAAADYTSSEGWSPRGTRLDWGFSKTIPLTALLPGLKDAETLLQPQLSSLAEALD